MSAPQFKLRAWFTATSLVVITSIAVLFGVLMSATLTQRMLQREGEVSMDFIQNLLATDQSTGYFLNPEDPELRERFLKSVEHLSAMREPVRANAYRPDGSVLWSTDPSLIGRKFAVNDELDDALAGELVVHSGQASTSDFSKEEHAGLARISPLYVESYIPIHQQTDKQVVGVMELYKVPTSLNLAIHETQVKLWAASVASALLLFLSLYWIVARAERIMLEQRRALGDAQALAMASQLSGAVAHNMRNPLASIRSSAELMAVAPASRTDLEEYAQDITQAVDRIDRWINDLIRVSQDTQPEPEPFTLAPAIAQVTADLKHSMLSRQITLNTHIAEAHVVMAHRAGFLQVYYSVLANAIEACESDGQIQVQSSQQGGLLTLSITDNGAGIPEGIMPKLFQPFFSTKSGGLGIGLLLVKRFMEHWQGQVHIQSVQPHGTRVSLMFQTAAKASDH